MALILPPSVTIDDRPSLLDGPPGSTVLSAVAWPNYFQLRDGDQVSTWHIDFVSPTLVPVRALRDAMEAFRVRMLWETAEEILAYAVHRSTEVEIRVPERICVAGHCWVPPWAGRTVTSLYRYRLVGVSQLTYTPVPAVRPMGPALLIVLFLGVIGLLATIVGLIEMRTGNIAWRDVNRLVKDIIAAPGENVAKPLRELSWPLAAMGFAMVAASVALPTLAARASARVPLWGAEVGGEVSTIPTAPPPPRRRP